MNFDFRVFLHPPQSITVQYGTRCYGVFGDEGPFFSLWKKSVEIIDHLLVHFVFCRLSTAA